MGFRLAKLLLTKRSKTSTKANAIKVKIVVFANIGNSFWYEQTTRELKIKTPGENSQNQSRSWWQGWNRKSPFNRELIDLQTNWQSQQPPCRPLSQPCLEFTLRRKSFDQKTFPELRRPHRVFGLRLTLPLETFHFRVFSNTTAWNSLEVALWAHEPYVDELLSNIDAYDKFIECVYIYADESPDWEDNSKNKTRQRQAGRIKILTQFLTVQHQDGPCRYFEGVPDNHWWVNLKFFSPLVSFFSLSLSVTGPFLLIFVLSSACHKPTNLCLLLSKISVVTKTWPKNVSVSKRPQQTQRWV